MKGVTHPKETVDRILALYRKSHTGRAIAEMTGVPRSTVQRIISGTVTMTTRKVPATAPKKQISAAAKPVIKVTTKHTFTPFTPPPGSPICNATSMGEPYRCPELSYRQSRA